MNASLYEEMARVEERHWWFQARRHIVWSLVRRYLPDADRRKLTICELGCGTGGNLIDLAARHHVVGVECSTHALEIARRRLGARVVQGSLPDHVALPADSFDVVLLTDVLEHIRDDAASARTALRLLRPAGIVVATVPAYQWLYSPRDAHHHHFRRYGKRQFARLWAGCDSESLLVSHYNTLLFPPAAAVRLATKLLPQQHTRPGDLRVPGSSLNRLLAGVMGSESNLLGRAPLPFGLSLVAVVRKRHNAGAVRAAA